jgi:hypothetical protein
VHPGVFGYGIQYAFPLRYFSLVVLHKGMYDYFPLEALEELRAGFVPIFANEVFVVLADRPSQGGSVRPGRPLRGLCYRNRGSPTMRAPRSEAAEIARPPLPTEWSSQPTIGPTHCRDRYPRFRAGAPVLVVDDGTTGEGGARNRDTAKACGADYLLLPNNRGLPAAINAGISYWLADPQVAWISCFQDDVDVHPAIFAHLEKVQEPTVRPILTGRLSGRHPTYGQERVGGEEIILMRGISGQHIHAHRDYWRGVLPIPSPYLGAPRHWGRLGGTGARGGLLDFCLESGTPSQEGRICRLRTRPSTRVPHLRRGFNLGKGSWRTGRSTPRDRRREQRKMKIWPSLPVPEEQPASGRPLKICIASNDIPGPVRNGGIGTANLHLAHTLRDAGHYVTLLYLEESFATGDEAFWKEHYRRQGLEFIHLPGTRERSRRLLRWTYKNDLRMLSVAEAPALRCCALPREDGNRFLPLARQAPWAGFSRHSTLRYHPRSGLVVGTRQRGAPASVLLSRGRPSGARVGEAC